MKWTEHRACFNRPHFGVEQLVSFGQAVNYAGKNQYDLQKCDKDHILYLISCLKRPLLLLQMMVGYDRFNCTKQFSIQARTYSHSIISQFVLHADGYTCTTSKIALRQTPWWGQGAQANTNGHFANFITQLYLFGGSIFFKTCRWRLKKRCGHLYLSRSIYSVLHGVPHSCNCINIKVQNRNVYVDLTGYTLQNKNENKHSAAYYLWLLPHF